MDNWECFYCGRRAPYTCTNCGPTCPKCGEQSMPFSNLDSFDAHQKLVDGPGGVICHDPAQDGSHWAPDRRGAAAWQAVAPGEVSVGASDGR